MKTRRDHRDALCREESTVCAVGLDRCERVGSWLEQLDGAIY